MEFSSLDYRLRRKVMFYDSLIAEIDSYDLKIDFCNYVIV